MVLVWSFLFTLNFKTLPILLYILTRGGGVNLSLGSLWYASLGSYVWSGTAYLSTLQAYYLHFSDGYVYPSNIPYRWFGFMARPVKP